MEETKVVVPAKFKDLVSKIEEMSVIELHELVKVLEEKLSNAFGGEINELSAELQEILIDDMVTAFENRLKVLINLNEKDDN